MATHHLKLPKRPLPLFKSRTYEESALSPGDLVHATKYAAIRTMLSQPSDIEAETLRSAFERRTDFYRRMHRLHLTP